MAQQVKIAGALFEDVPSIKVPDVNDVYHSFIDVTDTTATAGDVASGKYFYAADGTRTEGTSSGGGGITADDIAMMTYGPIVSGSASYISKFAFYSATNITAASFPNCTSIGSSAFFYCTNLTTASFPSCTYIGLAAFSSCSKLETVDIRRCTSVASSVFANCSTLRSVNCESLPIVGPAMFMGCSKLQSISLPNCSWIEANAFNRAGITTASFQSIKYIGQAAFSNCTSLETASFPNASIIGNSAFISCAKLVGAYFPSVKTISNYAFAYCRSLVSVNFPAVGEIRPYAFASCHSLSTADFPVVSNISSQAFASCLNLVELRMESVSAVPTLSTNAFLSTPIGGYSASAGRFGSVFVPASLYSSFLTATNWSSISSRIVSV